MYILNKDGHRPSNSPSDMNKATDKKNAAHLIL